MADHAISDDPAVQEQLDRLASLSPGADVLGLERITGLLARLGDPHLSLPPVFHVAGTNGKGSTCAFLRAALEADGRSVHVYTSPHLVRFNERIRLAGRLIDDALLADTLREVLDKGADIGASFFEVTTAVAFLLFAREPADACVIEVGLGGRLDATNVIRHPAVTAIAALGMDHEAFLGADLLKIAAEKAGIAKGGAPLVTLRYDSALASVIADVARTAGAPVLSQGRAWECAPYRGQLYYRDGQGRIDLPLPRLAGEHQHINAALAIAMLRHQKRIQVSEPALKAAPLWAHWPGRLQMLDDGPLVDMLTAAGHRPVWLDGGHNPSAGEALGKHFAQADLRGHRLHLIVGMLANKDGAGFLAPLRNHITHVHVVPVPGHDCHDAAYFDAFLREWGIGCSAHADPVRAAAALADAGEGGPVLICGSLYLAGEVLRLNAQMPD